MWGVTLSGTWVEVMCSETGQGFSEFMDDAGNEAKVIHSSQ